MHMALNELADETAPAERRTDLVRFAGLTGMELVSLVGEARTQLLAIARQLSHVQGILADQEKYSQAARVVEPVGLGTLVAEAVAMLSPGTHAAMTIEIDESVAGIGDVITARIALQQVIMNLLLNAAESIQRAGVRQGRLRIRATPEVVRGVLMAHLRLEDNGGGIAPENLKRIFERGFSTKTVASGQGLHWSANAVASLQGTIYAESAGTGRGACLHLLVPCARAMPARAVGE
jgi:signal transduction histidine kinase